MSDTYRIWRLVILGIVAMTCTITIATAAYYTVKVSRTPAPAHVQVDVSTVEK